MSQSIAAERQTLWPESMLLHYVQRPERALLTGASIIILDRCPGSRMWQVWEKRKPKSAPLKHLQGPLLLLLHTPEKSTVKTRTSARLRESSCFHSHMFQCIISSAIRLGGERPGASLKCHLRASCDSSHLLCVYMDAHTAMKPP